MSQLPGRSAASAMVFAGAAMRIYCGMATEYSAARNAVWLCPIVALLVFLPLAYSVYHAAGMGRDSPWKNLCAVCPKWLTNVATVIFSALLIYDCAISLRLTASSANFIALSDFSLMQLTLPLAIVLFFVIMLGADAEGNNARIWLKLIPLLLILVVCVQFEKYNPAWLSPVLGGGLEPIAQGGLLCSGWLALLSLPWLMAVPDRKQNNPIRPAILAAIAASLLLLALQMLCPAMVDANLSQIARVEIILSNNRVSHTLQMFLSVIWFGSLLHLIAIEAVGAACFIRNMLPRIPKWLVAVVCAAVISFLSMSSLIQDGHSRQIYPYTFAVIGGILAFMMSMSIVKKGAGERA